ncbi:hypothetical protein SLE2022_365700 [Rubroshorea leprosula]
MAKSSAGKHPHMAFGWAARDSSGTLSPFHFSRRENGDEDVTVKILYCGVCHSDLHFAKNEWGFFRHPIVPGTYGYSDMIVVDQRYVLRFPDNLPLDTGATLLCAGITVYSPMKYHGMTEAGKHLGVAGLGGLGHVAVKIAKAFGLKVTVINSSPKEESEAIDKLGADSFLVSTDLEKMKAAMGTMDFIMDTIPAVHPLLPLLSLLKMNEKLVTVGLPDKPLELPIFPLVLGRKFVGGSQIGGMKEMQEMIDPCAKRNIAADIELIRMEDINTAMGRLAKSDVRYRFVIDVGNSLSQ